MKLKSGEWIEKDNYRKRILLRPEMGSLIQIVQVLPGKVVEKHYHRSQTEFFYILRGNAKLRIGEEVYEAKAGDSFLCEALKVHSVDNREGKEPFEILVLKFNYHGEDSVWVR